ncbi:hypothetical protein, partial [Geobacillus thermoleovorans]|uniref:hypothetical protein n=1 Tax=Geobacillus thermoleovorans TaxID=33941 RepID=UPI00272E9B90
NSFVREKNVLPPVVVHIPSLPQVEQEKFFLSASLKKFFLLRLSTTFRPRHGAVRRSRLQGLVLGVLGQ